MKIINTIGIGRNPVANDPFNRHYIQSLRDAGYIGFTGFTFALFNTVPAVHIGQWFEPKARGYLEWVKCLTELAGDNIHWDLPVERITFGSTTAKVIATQARAARVGYQPEMPYNDYKKIMAEFKSFAKSNGYSCIDGDLFNCQCTSINNYPPVYIYMTTSPTNSSAYFIYPPELLIQYANGFCKTLDYPYVIDDYNMEYWEIPIFMQKYHYHIFDMKN